jgi:c-di-GMP-binding flagellar brake protein YcgR
MTADWPSLNSRAWMRLPCCGAEHPTRVEGFTETGCILAAPSLPHTQDVDPEIATDGFFVGWVSVHHALEVPVSFVEHTAVPVPTWTVEAAGDVQETQRRNYVRLVLDLDIEMDLIPGGAPTRARTVDLSEGGVKCLVDEWAPDPRERQFNVRVTIDNKTYVIPGQVAWWGNLDNKLRGVGVRFHHNDQHVADTIRSYIFAKQLEQRRRQNA